MPRAGRRHVLAVLMPLVLLAPARGGDPPPASVDLRPHLDGWGLSPRRQGKRNTCSVFVVTEAFEFAMAKASGKGRRLSVEYLNWAANRACGEEDDGSFFSDAWKGFETHGICAEDAMSYLPDFQPGIGPGQEAIEGARAALGRGLRFHWIKEWNPRRGISREQLAEVRRTLARGWPVCGGFLWPKAAVWDDGVLRICPRRDVRDGHSVLLVGYRDDPARPGGGVVLIRDTAGPGTDGLLTYEYLRTYMNDAAWIEAEIPAAASPPTPAGNPVPSTPPQAGRSRRI